MQKLMVYVENRLRSGKGHHTISHTEESNPSVANNNNMVYFVWADKCAAFIQKSMGGSFGWCSNWYRAKVAKELKKYGLRYDDLYDEMYDFDIMEAMHRLPLQVQDLRSQRLKRAMDCGFKHNYLDKEMQAKQTPFKFYIQDMLAKVKRERREREKQGSYMPYQREMP